MKKYVVALLTAACSGIGAIRSGGRRRGGARPDRRTVEQTVRTLEASGYNVIRQQDRLCADVGMHRQRRASRPDPLHDGLRVAATRSRHDDHRRRPFTSTWRADSGNSYEIDMTLWRGGADAP